MNESKLPHWIPEKRFRPYLEKGNQDVGAALEHYRWSHAMASELWTIIAHFEILLRHRIDVLLSDHFNEKDIGIPWFMQPNLLTDRGNEDIQNVMQRLVKQKKFSRDQVIAGLTFGFWKEIFGSHYDELWKACLHKVFSREKVQERKDATRELEEVRKLRNRVAHHDSLASVRIASEVNRILQLANGIDPEAGEWISENSQWRDLLSERPDLEKDTVVVAARTAWDIYQSTSKVDSLGAGFYVCQPGRFFRDVTHLGFYESRSIRREVPKILGIRDHVLWTQENATVLKNSSDRIDKKIGRLIEWSFTAGSGYPWKSRVAYQDSTAVDVAEESEQPSDTIEGSARLQVFVLSRPGHPKHMSLAQDLQNPNTGRGSAFTQRQRYVALQTLEMATSIDDLLDSDLQDAD